jgi:hypothetical protein
LELYVPRRIIDVRGERWEVAVNGARTQSTKDEFGLRFVRIAGGPPETRFVRYTPLGSKARESSLATLGDADLARFLTHSQPAWTAPESGYHR